MTLNLEATEAAGNVIVEAVEIAVEPSARVGGTACLGRLAFRTMWGLR
jgi:hypothetical protein